nr:hypothetical protein [Tanacetum cinerariifolium]
MVADALEERLSKMLSNTLKTILPDLLKYFMKKALPKLDKHVKKTLNAHVLDLFIKSLNKELNALNTLENNKTLDKADVNIPELVNLIRDPTDDDTMSVYNEEFSKNDENVADNVIDELVDLAKSKD